MSYIDIEKLNTVKDCDVLIVRLIQEGYKKYLNGKDGTKEFMMVTKIMKRSEFIKKRHNIRKRSINKFNKKIVDDIKAYDTIPDINDEKFKGIYNGES